MRGGQAVRALQIVVDGGCSLCDRAWALADRARIQFPALRVEMVNLAHLGTVRPEAAIAVPAYLLDGRVIFLGNPDPAQLTRTLTAYLQAPEQADADGDHE